MSCEIVEMLRRCAEKDCIKCKFRKNLECLNVLMLLAADYIDQMEAENKALERNCRKTKFKEETIMENKNEQYYIIRCDRAGVFFAKIAERRGDEADLVDCRRLWYWDGAASLSQLATDGVKAPENCKFTVAIPAMTVLGIIEIIPCTDEAVRSINGVRVWKR